MWCCSFRMDLEFMVHRSGICFFTTEPSRSNFELSFNTCKIGDSVFFLVLSYHDIINVPVSAILILLGGKTFPTLKNVSRPINEFKNFCGFCFPASRNTSHRCFCWVYKVAVPSGWAFYSNMTVFHLAMFASQGTGAEEIFQALMDAKANPHASMDLRTLLS